MNESGDEHADDIVIVDDDLLTLELVERKLRDTNFNFRCFSDELSALAYLQNHTTRVLLIDHRMPRLDGVDLLQRLNDGNCVPVTRVYLCSAAVLPADVCAKAQQFGARPLLKDIFRSKKEFLELLAKVLSI